MRYRWLLCRISLPLVAFAWLFIFSSLLVYHNLIGSGRLNNFFDQNIILQQQQQQQPEQPLQYYHPSDLMVRNIGAKSVVVLTYQRCGSTFFGQMFNTNPQAFYLFEPLDGLYAAMYGTKQGYNVPTAITNYQNGSERRIPQVEVDEVSTFISDFFSCDVTALPTTALVHAYWTQMPRETLRTVAYSRCLRIQPKTFRPRSCDKYNPFYCGSHFGTQQSESQLEDCRMVLLGGNVSVDRIPHAVQDKYRGYRKCLDAWRKQITPKCVPLLQKTCKASTLRAAKTVRATMASMDSLLRSSPDLHVIHLIRDPRAVASSRRSTRDDSIISRYSLVNGGFNATNITLKEAEIYCQRVVADVRVRLELEKNFPGRILVVNYEDVVGNLEAYTDDVYAFLGLQTPLQTKQWIVKNNRAVLKASRLSTYVPPVEKWTQRLSEFESRTIKDELCSEFFSLVKYGNTAAAVQRRIIRQLEVGTVS